MYNFETKQFELSTDLKHYLYIPECYTHIDEVYELQRNYGIKDKDSAYFVYNESTDILHKLGNLEQLTVALRVI